MLSAPLMPKVASSFRVHNVQNMEKGYAGLFFKGLDFL